MGKQAFPVGMGSGHGCADCRWVTESGHEGDIGYMEVVCKDLQGIAVLQLMGSVGFGESDKLANEPEILCRSRDAILDLEAVKYIDSAGLGRLVGLVQDYENAGRRLILAAPQDAVARIFTLTRLDKVMSITTTLDEAVALLSKGA